MRIINKGNTVVAVKNDDFIVVGISKNDVSKLRIYDSIGYRTILLDDRVTVTYSGKLILLLNRFEAISIALFYIIFYY